MSCVHTTKMAAGMRPRDGHEFQIHHGANVSVRVAVRKHAAAVSSKESDDDGPHQFAFAH
jgi:hypothetical protein